MNSSAETGHLLAPSDSLLKTRAVFVAPDGSDAHDGSLSLPLKSIQAAADVAAARGVRTVVLRHGTHYLSQPIELGSRHSGLTFTNLPGESPVVSGGVELKGLVWKAFNTSDKPGGPNIWVADVGTQVADVPGLQVDGARATRARYPNLPGGIEVSPGYGSMIPSRAAEWTPPDFAKFGNVQFYTDNISEHNRPNGGWFEHYMIGTRGLCSVYDPPVSYWCSQHPSGGGAFAFRTPSGVVPKPGVLPHAPYKDATDAIFFVWRPARWANWMFEMSSYDPKTGNFSFGKGGNQGARGENKGGDFFVENVFEELDAPGEFFFDKKSKRLFLWYNKTGSPASASVVVPQLRTLVNISGTQWQPVSAITHRGIAFRSARYTYMDPHGVPSAGDWALDRVGAVFMQGTEGCIFDGCTFERLDGNGVMVSGYNRNATITNSDFAYVGGNAIAAWGYTNETATDPGRPGVALSGYPQAGVDGTDGEHPRHTLVSGCSAREVGLYEKQSSFFVQAKTAQSTITGNVFFNGPRAGINANDGFGGGDEISHNLVFSTCRESGDHGPFNSWDRQPFLTTVRDGIPSMTMAWRSIHHNFFVDNYSPQEDVDNDDGSAYYHTHDNFLVYGGQGMKNDFGGHDNHHYGNVYAYVGRGLGVCSQLPGHQDFFYGNKIVMVGSDVGGLQCSGDAKTIVHDNAYYTATGNVSECRMPLAAWQAQGEDTGSVVSKWPSDDTIIDWAKEKLGF
eukprot:CAMPEP_0119345442 /NCGR_PEP_ID=MMETSP1333-20130426/107488_1 /TAXON_ID=418940 /ORGANISM="Scyphosphaera apsteinii, Strain RCC1455" /LENGTH=733 /DNA_ID=CAMNT_0007357911 /DNA_START=423 /DNA_END=2624 /DNA_ORIENTATION=+